MRRGKIQEQQDHIVSWAHKISACHSIFQKCQEEREELLFHIFLINFQQ